MEISNLDPLKDKVNIIIDPNNTNDGILTGKLTLGAVQDINGIFQFKFPGDLTSIEIPINIYTIWYQDTKKPR